MARHVDDVPDKNFPRPRTQRSTWRVAVPECRNGIGTKSRVYVDYRQDPYDPAAWLPFVPCVY